MGAIRMPEPTPDDLSVLADVMHLAKLERPSWRDRMRRLRASGAPLNEGDAAAEGATGEPGAEGGAAGATGADAGAAGDAAILDAAKNPDAVQRALQAERDTAAAARAELASVKKQLEERSAGDQSAEERIAALEDTVAKTGRELALARISKDTGVPEDVITGGTADEMKASADNFLTHAKAMADAAVEQALAAAAGQSGGARPRPIPKDLDEQIAEAEKKDDWALAGRLKAQKLGTAPAPNA